MPDICPFLRDPSSPDGYVECLQAECMVYNAKERTCSIPSTGFFAESIHRSQSLVQKNIMESIHKATDALLLQHNESRKGMQETVDQSFTQLRKTVENLFHATTETSQKIKNLGTTLYAYLSDAKENREILVAPLQAINAHLNNAIYAIEQSGENNIQELEKLKFVVKQLRETQLEEKNILHEELANVVTHQQATTDEIGGVQTILQNGLTGLEAIIQTSIETYQEQNQVLRTSVESLQGAVQNLHNLLHEKLDTHLRAQEQFYTHQTQKIDEQMASIDRAVKTSESTRELIDRRLGEYLAAERAFVAMQTERINEEVRLMSELYKTNKQILTTLSQQKELQHHVHLEDQRQLARIHNDHGNRYFYRHAYQAAVYEFEQAVALDDTRAEYYCNLGLTLLELGDVDHARGNLEKSVELNPDLVEGLLNLAVLDYNAGDLESALHQIDLAIQKNPNFALAYDCLGSIYFYKNDYRQACDAWSTAIKLDPSLENARRNLAVFQANTVEASSAISTLDK